MVLTIETFTDPCCPWAWTAEAWRLRLHWCYGEQLTWRRRLVVISDQPGAPEAAGFTPAVEQHEDTEIATRWGMPLHLGLRPRVTISLPACLAIVAARHLDPDGGDERLLRALWVRGRAHGEMTDELPVIARAAADAALDPGALATQMRTPDVAQALADDRRAARAPLPPARHLADKLGGPPEQRRYASPTWTFTHDQQPPWVAPGFQPPETYDTALANLAPELQRRPAPHDAIAVLTWAGQPLATAEVAAVLEASIPAARARLRDAHAHFAPAGSDGFWSPTP